MWGGICLAEIIEFPKPKKQLTYEETKEFDEIKQFYKEAKTLRQLFICWFKLRKFKKKLKKRTNKWLKNAQNGAFFKIVLYWFIIINNNKFSHRLKIVVIINKE